MFKKATPQAVASTPQDVEGITVDFTLADKEPQGELRLQLMKIEQAQSSKGNKMLKVQMKVVESPADPDFVGRVIFDQWMLVTNAVFRTKEALKAFTGAAPKGVSTIKPSELVGQTAWCRVEIEVGSGEYEGRNRPVVKKYGIKVS